MRSILFEGQQSRMQKSRSQKSYLNALNIIDDLPFWIGNFSRSHEQHKTPDSKINQVTLQEPRDARSLKSSQNVYIAWRHELIAAEVSQSISHKELFHEYKEAIKKRGIQRHEIKRLRRKRECKNLLL